MNNAEDLRKSNRIIFECVAGSIAYGLNTPKSDVDLRGFYVNPRNEYLGLNEPVGQVSNDKNDIVFYSLKKAFELLTTANPNMIELLWMPEDCIRFTSVAYCKMIQNRELFISKKCYHTHSGYAFAQIQKAKGQNKKVHNPQPEAMPKKENFCWIIPGGDIGNELMKEWKVMPCRPVPLNDIQGFPQLKSCHCSALEHVENTYRLYDYGPVAKGVFRGDDMLVTEPIPFEDEIDRFVGLLVYNKDAHEKAMREWKSYWDWMKNRNEHRWVDQERGKLNYDQKNMMHCVRLLMSGESILRTGVPLVRFEGAERDYLMKIRAGEFQYDELMAEVERRMATLDELKESSAIPHSVNMSKIENLYREVCEEVEYERGQRETILG